MLVRAYLPALALLLGLATSARAALIVTIHDATIPAGGTGFVNVTVASYSGDLLSDFGFEFLITTTGVTRLEFVDPQPDPQLTNPDYVFFGNSLAETLSLPVGNVGTTVVPKDTFIGTDGTADATNVTLTMSKLLVQLQVTAATTLPPVPGDTFIISLEPQGSPFSFFSFFNDQDQLQDVPFMVTPGTVTIGAAIPEPGSLSLFFLLGTGLVLTRRFRRQ
jgi:hypothetical protein